MASLDSLINARRSIRKYTAALPPAAWIEEMVLCAARAPSPSNSQPVRFFRINSVPLRDALYRGMVDGHQELLATVAKSGAPKRLRNWINAYRRFAEFMFDAPVLLAVGVDASVNSLAKRLSEAQITGRRHRLDTDMDMTAGLALKGFILKAQDRGLGTCILTAPLAFISDTEQILGLENIRIQCFVTVGFPAETPPAVERKALAEIYREL